MKELDRRGTYVGNIGDVRVREVVSRISDACFCFVQSPRWDGHAVNPPCATIVQAREIVDALDGDVARV